MGKNCEHPDDPEHAGAQDYNDRGHRAAAQAPGCGDGAVHKRGKGVGAAHDPQPRQARLHHLRIPCKEG